MEERLFAFPPETSVQTKLLEAARVLGTDFGLLGGGTRGSVIFRFHFLANCTKLSKNAN